MITIKAFTKSNGITSVPIELNKVVQDRSELNALKSQLMAQNKGYEINLIYEEKKDTIPEPVYVPIEIHVKDQSGVIERNKINIKNFINKIYHE